MSHTGREVAQAAVEFVSLTKSGDIVESIEKFAEYAKDERFGVAVRATLIAQNGGGATKAAPEPGKRFSTPRIRWATPKGKERAKADKAWTAKAGKLALRVERAETPAGVMFRAFVSDSFIGQDHLMTNAQTIAADEAIRRLKEMPR